MNNLDAATVLEQYISDISNLPGEIAHVLEEIRDKDLKFYETRKRIQQRDNQIHKFIRANGSLAENPKEAQTYPKIRSDFDKAKALQVEKNDLSIMGLYLIAKHLKKLNDKIDALEKEGMIAPENTGGYEDDMTREELNDVLNLANGMLPSVEMNPLLHSMIEAAQSGAMIGSDGLLISAPPGAFSSAGGSGLTSGVFGPAGISSRAESPGSALAAPLQSHLRGDLVPARLGGAPLGTIASGNGRTSSSRQSARSASVAGQTQGGRKHTSPGPHSRSVTPANDLLDTQAAPAIKMGGNSLTSGKGATAVAAAAAAAGIAGNGASTPIGPGGASSARPSKRQKLSNGGSVAGSAVGTPSATGSSSHKSTVPGAAAGSSRASARNANKNTSASSSRNGTPAGDEVAGMGSNIKSINSRRGASSSRASISVSSAAASAVAAATSAADNDEDSDSEDQSSFTQTASSATQLKANSRRSDRAEGKVSRDAEDEVYCSCRQVSFGNMIGCDNDACPYEWFHLGCVGLVEPPQGKWYCPTCTQAMAKEKETKKRSRN